MSNLSLERLLFDPSDIASGPKVGSYLVGAGGTCVDTVADALKVNVTNTVAISASDLDIRDLAYGTDSVTAYQGGLWNVTAEQSGVWNVNLSDDSIADGDADSGNPFKVGGKAYNQASALGAVDANDRANLAQDLYRRVFINDAPNISVASAKVSVANTATALPASALAGRTRVMIQNIGANPVYVGPSGVAITSGIKVEKGATLSLEAGQAIALYGICAAGTVDVIVFELA